MLVGLAIGSILVGGMLYVMLQSQKSENVALKRQIAYSERPIISQKAPVSEVHEEQLGIVKEIMPLKTPAETANTSVNLAMYEDTDIPQIKFMYDKNKWNIENLRSEHENTVKGMHTLQLAHMGGMLTFTIINACAEKLFNAIPIANTHIVKLTPFKLRVTTERNNFAYSLSADSIITDPQHIELAIRECTEG